MNVQTQFGAAGNGSADDTAAIQAAINSLVPYGGVIYFPAGQYMLKSGVPATLPSFQANTLLNVSFIGDVSGYGTKIQTTSGTADVIYGAGVKAFTMKNLEIQGPGTGTGIGIHLQCTSAAGNYTLTTYVDIADCSVYNTGGDGITIDNPLCVTLHRIRSPVPVGTGSTSTAVSAAPAITAPRR